MKMKIIAASAMLTSLFNSSNGFRSNNGTYYWFYITKNSIRLGAKPCLKNADVLHGYAISTTNTALPALNSFSSCSGQTYFCVGGFTTAQLTAGHNFLKTSAILCQTPFTAGYTRN